jgi:hypothetical protein
MSDADQDHPSAEDGRKRARAGDAPGAEAAESASASTGVAGQADAARDASPAAMPDTPATERDLKDVTFGVRQVDLAAVAEAPASEEGSTEEVDATVAVAAAEAASTPLPPVDNAETNALDEHAEPAPESVAATEETPVVDTNATATSDDTQAVAPPVLSVGNAGLAIVPLGEAPITQTAPSAPSSPSKSVLASPSKTSTAAPPGSPSKASTAVAPATPSRTSHADAPVPSSASPEPVTSTAAP